MTNQESNKNAPKPNDELPESALSADVGKLAVNNTKNEQSDTEGTYQNIKTLLGPLIRWASWPFKRLAKSWDSLKSAEYSNRIIAVATVVIAIAAGVTLYETIEAGEQTDKIIEADKKLAEATERSADEMKRSADQAVLASRLQVQLARIEGKLAFVDLTPWMGFFYEGDKMYAIVQVHVVRGMTGADDMQIAAQMDFDLRPSEDGTFKLLKQTSLPAFDAGLPPWNQGLLHKGKRTEEVSRSDRIYMIKPVPPAEHSTYANRLVYVWGRIRYRDFTTDWGPDVKFCRQVIAGRIFASGEGDANGLSSSNDCDTKTQSHNQ